MKEYYIVSFKHIGSQDNSFEFWRPNGGGYTRAIEEAGLYELENDFERQKSMFKAFIHKDIIEKLKQPITLPKYGNVVEKYAGLNEFHVLPNTGQVRKLIGITKLDFNINGNRDSFDAYFTDEVLEKYKYVYQDGSYTVKAKESEISEHWFYDEEFKAKSRNKAILQAYKEWDFWEMTYIEFKSKVTCRKTKVQVLDKWVDTGRKSA